MYGSSLYACRINKPKKKKAMWEKILIGIRITV